MRNVVLRHQEVNIALNLQDDVSEHHSSLGILLCHGDSREKGEDSREKGEDRRRICVVYLAYITRNPGAFRGKISAF